MSIYLAVMDPPWNADAGGGGRGAENHYHLSGPADVARAVQQSGLWKQDGDALVWCWVTTRAMMTGDAFKLFSLLNLTPVSSFVWNKIDEVHEVKDRDGDAFAVTGDLFKPPAKMGLGQWQRTEHEHLVICRRGSIGVPAPAARHRSAIYAPRGAHSAKPERAWQVIESTSASVVGDLDERWMLDGHCGVELFARTARPRWLAFGDQLQQEKS